MKKHQTLTDEHMNQVIWAGGLPIRRGDYITYLDEVAKEQAKIIKEETGKDYSWLRLRDAGMLGNYQFNEKHGYPPEGTKPYTLAEFKAITETSIPPPQKGISRGKSLISKGTPRITSKRVLRGLRH